jgi:hypothetical protein
MIYSQQLQPNGTDALGTFAVIVMDARFNLPNLIDKASYHADARGWAGFELRKAARFDGPQQVLYRKAPSALDKK